MKGARIGFILLGLANLVFVAYPLYTYNDLVQQANAGVSGTEFMGLLLIPFFLIMPFVLAANAISIPLYLRKHKVHPALAVVGWLVAVASVIWLIWVLAYYLFG